MYHWHRYYQLQYCSEKLRSEIETRVRQLGVPEGTSLLVESISGSSVSLELYYYNEPYTPPTRERITIELPFSPRRFPEYIIESGMISRKLDSAKDNYNYESRTAALTPPNWGPLEQAHMTWMTTEEYERVFVELNEHLSK